MPVGEETEYMDRAFRRMRLPALAVGLSLIFSGVVSAAETLRWEDLAPPFDEAMDPFRGLDEDQQAALYEFALAPELTETEKLDPELQTYRDEARKTLESAGLDIKALLARVERYEQYVKIWNDTLLDDLDGREIRMPGYALPLEFEGTTVTEFLLVPYVGACIHTPPPPPNQIVHVRAGAGFESDGPFMPVWVTGRIATGRQSVNLSFIDGAADVAVGYRIEAAAIEPYVE